MLKYLIILLILSLFLAGCESVSRNQNDNDLLNWKFGDLRLLDAIDAPEPDQDLIAVYTRFNDQSFQIRLDFLDLTTYLGKDIYIPLDTNPGGHPQIKTNNNGSLVSDIDWDYLLKITDSGTIEILNDQLSPLPAVELFIVYDSPQDRMIISFNKGSLPIYYGRTKLQVIITPANQNVVSDKSEPFFIDAPSPSKAEVLFAFWNTFSSNTPAQTLRSWAGAHTGPMSSRHGLRYLIDAAAKTNSTVFLLDLLTPDTLSALDYINVLPRVRNLRTQGILALPDIGNIKEIQGTGTNPILVSSPNLRGTNLDLYKIWQISDNLKEMNNNKNFDFLLLLNNILYVDYMNNNVIVKDYAHYFDYVKGCELVPFSKVNGLFTDKLSTDCKSLLLSNALLQSTSPLILGGDFSNSILGDPTKSMEVFMYIHAHPWIQVLSISDLMGANELLSLSSGPNNESNTTIAAGAQKSTISSNSTTSVIQNKVYGALLHSPRNHLTDLAWKVFSNLTQLASPELSSLRSNYINQIGYILSAAEWAENPSPKETCDIDLDYDGIKECILANNNLFAIIEPEGGYIPFIFAKDAQGIHQIIGPTWEFTVGLSDSSSWKLALGVRSDSAQLLGAFQDPFEYWNIYNVNLMDNTIVMDDLNMAMRKSVSISSKGFHIAVVNPSIIQNISDIPLVIDPWLRYTSGWGNLYTQNKQFTNFQWGINSGEMVTINASIPIHVYSFNDTRSLLSYPEDPNYDYSRGHYLPYPMSVVELNETDKYSVDIIINP